MAYSANNSPDKLFGKYNILNSLKEAETYFNKYSNIEIIKITNPTTIAPIAIYIFFIKNPLLKLILNCKVT